MSDATAPQSPNSVLRFPYPANYTGIREAAGRIDAVLSGSTKMYASIWVKWSSNWQGHTSATNKLIFNWIHDNPAVFLSIEGVGNGSLVPMLRLQNTADSREYLSPNVVPGTTISRGVWHRWEYQLIANAPGSANGTVRWWIDGVLVGEYTNVRFAGSGQANTWQYLSINPTWGGSDPSAKVNSAMYIDVDHVYLSAAP